MINRTMIAFTSIIAVLGLVVIVTFEPKVSGASLSAQQQPAGCTTCHGTGNTKALVGEVPTATGHFQPDSAGPSDVNYCLQCHTLAAAAPAFSWTVHQSHFAGEIATAGKTATCDLCHTIDASANFTLTGASNSPSFKTTAAVVAGMPTYYTSWATSKHLDHTHGLQSVTCTACHGTPFPTTAPTMETACFPCHGNYDQLVARDSFHINAEYPMWGDGSPAQCTECHRSHEQSVCACDQCHGEGYCPQAVP